MDNTKKPPIIPIREILSDKKLTLFDKFMYLLYYIALIVAIILFARTFWLYKSVDFVSVVILIILFSSRQKFYQKYTKKYRDHNLQHIQEIAGVKAKELEEKRFEYVQNTPKEAARSIIEIWGAGLYFLIGFVITMGLILLLSPIFGDSHPSILIGIAITGFGISAMFSIYKTIKAANFKKDIQVIRSLKLPARDIIIAIIIIGGIMALVAYRVFLM